MSEMIKEMFFLVAKQGVLESKKFLSKQSSMLEISQIRIPAWNVIHILYMNLL